MHTIKEDTDEETKGYDGAREEDEHRWAGGEEDEGGEDREGQHEPARYLVEGSVDVFQSKVAEAGREELIVRHEADRQRGLSHTSS